MKILVLSYGVGNIFSISNALKRLGADVIISREPTRTSDFDALVMPGVGSFAAAAENIAPYREELREKILNETPTLGICLGMQVMFGESEEGPGRGLEIFRGSVVALPPTVKRPHMGWNTIKRVKDTPLMEGIEEAWVYFNHTYYPNPREANIVAAKAEYGVEFPAVISEKHIFGTQFHPEKSSKIGEQMLRNFLEIVKR